MVMIHTKNGKSGVQLELDQYISTSISKIVSNIDYKQSDTTQDNIILNEIFQLRDSLPESLTCKINEFKHNHISYLRINGLPQNKYAEVLLLISGLLGLPFCHTQESSLVSVVKPKKMALGSDEISYYTWNKFSLHSELPYVKNPPDFLALHCKNNVQNGFTHTASVDEAVALLDKKDIETLLLPNFQIVIPPHFNHKEPYAPYRSIIERIGDHYRVRIRFDDIRCKNEENRGALERLFTALDQVKIQHHLASGDMLIINNNASLHGRSSFKPSFDDQDRELYRVYIYSDCSKILSNLDYENKRISGF